jgi:Tol biopolymer transport system component
MATEVEELLLECREQMRCMAPVLSPDGSWLAFEQTEYEQGVGGKPVPVNQSIHVMPTDPPGEAFLASDPTHQSSNPRWSPDGSLEFYDNQIKATVILSIANQATFVVDDYVPNSLGQPLAWDPQGDEVIYAEIVFPAEVLGSERAGAITIPEGESSFFSHLYHSNLTTGVVSDISPGTDPMVEDSSPSYSPDGRSVAFLRRYLDSARWTLGRQVWMMTSEGMQAVPITELPDHNHSALQWSPDGRRILWMRGQSGYPGGTETTIHWYDVQTGDSGQIVEGGYLPQWIP